MSKEPTTNRFDFKAWDTVNEKMLDFNNFTLHGYEEQGWLPCDLEGKLLVTKKDPHTLIILQFTGRKDRIGQKIYDRNYLKGDYGEIYEVVYDESTAGYKLKDTDNPKAPLKEWKASSKMVIVGNAFEGEYFLEEN